MSSQFADCTVQTDRLLARNWHVDAGAGWPPDELIEAVVSLLTPKVTESLPVGWQGEYTPERARRWTQERDAESVVLEVIERSSQRTIGLMLLNEEQRETGETEIRLGYLLAEQVWGRGLATELLTGFVDWCEQFAGVVVISAGVDAANPASARVLEKCGFARLPEHDTHKLGEHLYQLVVE